MPRRGKAGALDTPIFGFHKTRTGVAFSPWNADSGVPLHAPPTFDLHKLLEQSLQERAQLEKDGPLEDEVEIEEPEVSSPSSLPFSPPSSGSDSSSTPPQDVVDVRPEPVPPTSPPTKIFFGPIERPVAVPQNATSSPTAPGADVPRGAVCADGLMREEYRRLKKRENDRVKRREDRTKQQEQVGDALKAATRRYRASCLALPVDFMLQPKNVHIARTGVLGKAMKKAAWHKKKMSFNAAKQLPDFNIVQWSGQNTCLMVDASGRVFGSLASPPKDATWPDLIKRVSEKFAKAQAELAELEPIPEHRRGPYYYVNTGLSIGSGQTRVGRLKNPARYRKILDDLMNDDDVRRIANFGSVTLSNYHPDVHKYYSKTLDALLAADSSLKRNFVNNVFAAATFNLGPQVATNVHLDHLNLAFGLCAITALGDYDYTKGGHLILWDLKLIIEFPPGTTILIPSSILRHSNVAVRRNETRYSFTQYSAAGLFRWVRCGFQSAKAYVAKGNDMSKEYDEWKDGYKLYSLLSDLQASVSA